MWIEGNFDRAINLLGSRLSRFGNAESLADEKAIVTCSGKLQSKVQRLHGKWLCSHRSESIVTISAHLKEIMRECGDDPKNHFLLATCSFRVLFNLMPQSMTIC